MGKCLCSYGYFTCTKVTSSHLILVPVYRLLGARNTARKDGSLLSVDLQGTQCVPARHPSQCRDCDCCGPASATPFARATQ